MTATTTAAGAGGWMSGSCTAEPDHRRNGHGGAHLGLYGGHEPQPSGVWPCRLCGQLWPCEPVKRRLIDTLTLRTCGHIMLGWLRDAAPSLSTDAAGLFDRFLVWIWLLPADRPINQLPARR